MKEWYKKIHGINYETGHYTEMKSHKRVYRNRG